MTENLPTHQHQSLTQKQAKDTWNDLVKMTELQCEFQVLFKSWLTDETKSGEVVTIGEALMELQKSTGKSGGKLDRFQVMHRVESAKDSIRKNLDQPVVKSENGTKNIRKSADGSTTWVISRF